MTISRRSFLQSSLMAGLAGAADATCTRWLLSSNNAVRIGITNLGTSASEHLALLAAVPGAEIIGVVDRDPRRVTAALHQLRELGQPTPTLYRNVEHMLSDQRLEAVVLSNDAITSGPSFRQILDAGLPVLTEFPPPLPVRDSRLYGNILRAQKPIHFRLADFTYPASSADVTSWLKRGSPNKPEARLMISSTVTMRELRIATIVAIDALLAISSVPIHGLMPWLSSNDAGTQIRDAGTGGSIGLPDNFANLRALRIHLLGGLRNSSRLVVEHKAGSIELPISRTPHALSSLKTLMRFLQQVREPKLYQSLVSTKVYIAACLADGFMQGLPGVAQRRV